MTLTKRISSDLINAMMAKDKELAGKADGKDISAKVKQLLNS